MIKWLVAIGFCMFLWGLIEANMLRVKHLSQKNFKTTLKSDGFRIVFVSDFQLDRLWGFNHYFMKKVVTAINDAKPDLVILGGDYIHEKRRYKQPIFSYLSMIDAQKIGVLGNHDYNDISTVLEGLQSSSVKLLNNSGIYINNIYFYGVDDYTRGKPSIETLDAQFIIGISHEPEVFELHDAAMQFDIGLAGHHHGGQISFFGKYAPAVRSEFGQQLVYGEVDIKNFTISITSGIGGFPLRICARPEIVVIDI